MELLSSGEFPSVFAARRFCQARFRLMSDLDAGIDDSRPGSVPLSIRFYPGPNKNTENRI